MFLSAALILAFTSLTLCDLGPESDLVTELPGLKVAPNFRHYSGYLETQPGHQMHYWFVESQNEPSKDPIILYLNGGPGCSSLMSMFLGNGPWRYQKTLGPERAGPEYLGPGPEKLGPEYSGPGFENLGSKSEKLGRGPENLGSGTEAPENSGPWAEEGILVPFEFSWNRVANMLYLEAPVDVGFSYSTDNVTYSDETTARDNHLAIKQFLKKFANHSHNDFYIAGVSYGGTYVPTLASRVADDLEINLKGIAIGNGWMNHHHEINSVVEYVYFHGLMGKEEYESMRTECCESNAIHCDFFNPRTEKCAQMVLQVESIIWSSGLNIYNYIADCNPIENTTNPRVHCDPFDSEFVTWLNRADVQRALHIPPQAPSVWAMCGAKVQAGYVEQYFSVRNKLLKLINKNIKIVIYNGDLDMACNFLAAQWFTSGFGLEKEGGYRQWHYGKEVAGFYQKYENNVTVMTFKGAGHEAPGDKPGPGFKMIQYALGLTDL